MDMTILFNALLSTGNPVLPHPAAMRVALHLVWAIVLGSGVLLATGKLARSSQLGLSGLVILWTLLPGSVSPAYWLGLAFQTPSLTSAVLCLGWFLNRRGQVPGTEVSQASVSMGALKILAGAGIALGWVLLLDTLALLPLSVYAWGFSAAALGAVAAFAALLWAVWGRAESSRRGRAPVLLWCGLALFVLTRLPTGNVWDALIDPWLWAGLQVGWLVSAVRQMKAKRLPAATRA